MEMPVITGDRTDKFNLLQLRPGREPLHRTVDKASFERVGDHVDARTSTGEDLLRRHAEYFGKEAAHLGYPLEFTVIADVHSVLADKIIIVQRVKHRNGEVKLGHIRFAPGHIQFQAKPLQLIIFFTNFI